MVVRWQFYDPVEAETYTFNINPNSGGSPEYKKSVTFQNTTAPNGKTLIYEGQDETRNLQWSGVILEQDHYEKYIEWWQKRRQIKLTDDLGREYWIYLQTFVPTRVRARSYPWKHTFEVTAIILDWVT